MTHQAFLIAVRVHRDRNCCFYGLYGVVRANMQQPFKKILIKTLSILHHTVLFDELPDSIREEQLSLVEARDTATSLQHAVLDHCRAPSSLTKAMLVLFRSRSSPIMAQRCKSPGSLFLTIRRRKYCMPIVLSTPLVESYIRVIRSIEHAHSQHWYEYAVSSRCIIICAVRSIICTRVRTETQT